MYYINIYDLKYVKKSFSSYRTVNLRTLRFKSRPFNVLQRNNVSVVATVDIEHEHILCGQITELSVSKQVVYLVITLLSGLSDGQGGAFCTQTHTHIHMLTDD
jgi:hypothetical protein